MHLPRRRFLSSSLGLLALPTLGCSTHLRDVQASSLAQALQELDRLSQASALHSSTVWGWPKTLVHLAQSIEYSMLGYPSQHSALFQRTLGRAAFGVFSWRQQMRHDLTEPIPGSPAIREDVALHMASQRLLQACQQFVQWTGPLQPHFAYGQLTHAEYEQAHAMHLANHFSAFQVR